MLKNILIVQTAFLGDITFLTIPLKNNLRTIFNETKYKIHVLTKNVGKEILHSQKVIDNIIVYDKKGKNKGFKNLSYFVNILKIIDFDIAVDPHRFIRSSLLYFFGKNK